MSEIAAQTPVTKAVARSGQKDTYGMTYKQREFADLFLLTDNATRSYMEVYDQSDYHAAQTSASALLSNSVVSSYVHMRRDIVRRRSAKKYELTKERVDAELAKLAFVNAQDLYCPETGVQIPPHLLDRDVAAAIAGFNNDGYKLHDKRAVLDLISKNEGFQDKHQRAGAQVTVIHVPDIDKGDKAGL